MDSPVGFGGYKLQQLVQQEIQMKRSVDSSVVYQKQMSPKHNYLHSQYRNEMDFRSRRAVRAKTRKFQLQVSDSSSFDTLSSSNSSSLSSSRLSPKSSVRSLSPQKQLQNQQASATLKLMASLKQDTNISQNSQKTVQNVPQYQSNPSSFQMSQSGEKKRISFLKGLKQNSIMSDHNQIEEYYKDGKVFVKLQSKDFLTFMRWTHEIEELKRKKKDFENYKERHHDLAKGDNIQKMEQQKMEEIIKLKKKRYTQSWIVGISLAKRFLRIGRARAQQQLNKNKHKTLFIPIRDPMLSSLNDSMRSEDPKLLEIDQDKLL